MKLTAIYARVSTLDQDADDKTSLEMQISECTKYCVAQKLGVIHVLTDTYSGNKLDRPELKKLRALVRAKEVECIVCYSDDRLTRNPGHWLVLLEEVKANNVALHYASTGKIEFTPEGEMLAGIKSQFNQYWLNKIVETMIKGKYGMASNGQYVKSPKLPYGYSYDTATKTLVINEVEAHIVRRIFDMYTEQYLSTYKICTILNEEGIVSPRQGKKWYSGTLRRILIRTENIGKWIFGKNIKREFTFSVPTSVVIPALVNEEQYAKALVQMKKNRRVRKPLEDRYNHMFANRITCNCCGNAVYTHTSKYKGVLYSYYHNRCRENIHRCTTPAYKAKELDTAVWGYICNELLDPPSLEANLLAVQKAQQTKSKLPELEANLASIHSALAKVEKQQDELLNAVLTGVFPAHLIADKSRELEATRLSLVASIAEVEAQMSNERVLTATDIQTISQFAQVIAVKLDAIKEDRVALEHLFDTLDIHIILDYDQTTSAKKVIVNSILDTGKILDITSDVDTTILKKTEDDD